jgi:hypothetical protein
MDLFYVCALSHDFAEFDCVKLHEMERDKDGTDFWR